MAFIENFVTPLIKTILLSAFFLWILFMIGWVVYKVFLTPRRLQWMKFKLFRKKYEEEDVAWCMEAIDRGLSETEIRKHCLLNGTPQAKIEEICFIFSEVYKNLKGGKQNHGGSEKGNGKVKLPKIK